MDTVNLTAKFEVRSFTRSWDNSNSSSGYLKKFVQYLDMPFKVVDFGTNRKHVYDFLLVRNSNLSPILHCFGDCAPEWPHPYSTLILGVFPLHQMAHVGVSPGRGLKLLLLLLLLLL